MNSPRIFQTRRQFLVRGGLGASALAAGFPAVLRARSPNEKLNIAIIGSGGRGAGNLAAVSHENIVALCDVNEGNLEAAARKHPQARKYLDFRKLYDRASDIDAVVISSTEHTHALATLPALQLGKHVFCEKPLTHTVWEARVITEAAKQAGVATQMGIQIHAGSNFRRVVELVQSGAIGDVTEAHVWVGRSWGRQSEEAARRHNDIVFVTERPQESMPVPEGLHWDLWLGPAPERPFHEVYFPGPKWYRWWDFGGGTMSDLGSHFNDLPFWALKLRYPLTVEASGPPPHSEIAPASMTVTYEFGSRGKLPPVKLVWYQGEEKPGIWREGKIPQWGSGMLFVGSKGMLLSDYGKHVLLPEEQFEDFTRPDPFIPESIGHHQEWVHACKTGAETTCNFDYSGPLTESNHLGNVAYRLGKKLIWDGENVAARNAPEAAGLIRREYRQGWKDERLSA
jgi:predicted dehydrogenase